MSEQTPTPKKTPLQSWKNGSVNVQLWEQQGKDGHTYVNASISKSYWNHKTGNWQQTSSFNAQDVQKLQSMLPEVQQEMTRW
jgi:hypothetical protein